MSIINRYSISVKTDLLKLQLTLFWIFIPYSQMGKYDSRRIIVARYLSLMVEIFVKPEGTNGNILNFGKDLIISHIPFWFTTQCSTSWEERTRMDSPHFIFVTPCWHSSYIYKIKCFFTFELVIKLSSCY